MHREFDISHGDGMRIWRIVSEDCIRELFSLINLQYDRIRQTARLVEQKASLAREREAVLHRERGNHAFHPEELALQPRRVVQTDNAGRRRANR